MPPRRTSPSGVPQPDKCRFQPWKRPPARAAAGSGPEANPHHSVKRIARARKPQRNGRRRPLSPAGLSAMPGQRDRRVEHLGGEAVEQAQHRTLQPAPEEEGAHENQNRRDAVEHHHRRHARRAPYREPAQIEGGATVQKLQRRGCPGQRHGEEVPHSCRTGEAAPRVQKRRRPGTRSGSSAEGSSARNGW